ncbi:MAG: diaminopimelate epimerase [Actinomycetota bacterium]|nr:diaminopimelate epimerase [Actinomycetota bacterium]
MDFVKVQGLGNDFIVFDGPFEPTESDVVRWCSRMTGIGADGVLVIEPETDSRVLMRYWNADGGEAEMCGNGLRCVALLAWERGWVAEPDFVVQTAVGDHPVMVRGEVVKAFVGVPKRFRTEPLSIAGNDLYPMSIGNPHAVIFVDDVDEADVTRIGPIVEHDALFPDRTNVEFVQVLDEGGIKARIWERGVGETLASGTGAAASAYMAHAVHDVAQPIRVQLRGGTLTISIDDAGAWMEGPAEIVFSGSTD